MEKQKSPIWYKRRRNWVVAIVLVIAIFVIRGATAGSTKPRESVKVERGTVKEELVLSGELKAVQYANLQFNSSGTLAWVGVKAGDRVVKGQALAKLDTVSLNAAYQQSLANLRLADATVDQVHDSLKGKDSTETYTEKVTRITAESAKDKAYDAFIASQKALRDATLVSPFEGMVSTITNEAPGLNITAGTAQVTVVNPSTLYFLVNADQTEVSKIHIGDTAELTLDAYTGERVMAKVSQISFTPSTVESGTVYPLRLTLSVDNTSYKYRVGMTGDAQFILSQKENTLNVPTKYVKSDKDGRYVYTDEKNTKKYIELGIEGDERIEIKGDITEGTLIYD